MVPCHFEVDYRCPVKLEYITDHVTSAVNAVAICTDFSWEDIVKSLIEQAHLRAYMPAYITCVTDMLRVNGFASMPEITHIKDLLSFHEKEKAPAGKYIVRFYNYGYCAVVSNSDGNGFCIKGIRETRCDIANFFIEACWKYIPGTDNRTGIKRDGFLMPDITVPNKNLAVKNMNPKDHNIGDCAVRALCAALECTWDEAVDLLIKANHYTNPIINLLSNINNALIGLEFERHRAIRRNGRLLTGKQFCEQMTYTFHNGERIFAYVGRSHCAAVLPFTEEDGSVRYKAQDTWDSTDRKIGDYWVIPPRSRRERIQPKAQMKQYSDFDLKIGNSISHPVFGKGIITSDCNNVLTIDFAPAGVKRFSKDWLLKIINNANKG